MKGSAKKHSRDPIRLSFSAEEQQAIEAFLEDAKTDADSSEVERVVDALRHRLGYMQSKVAPTP